MLRVVPVTASGAVEPGLVERVRLELGERRTLADVLDWARSQRPPRTIHGIVTQDEYTHDSGLSLTPIDWAP